MEAERLDGMLISFDANVRYLTGFSGEGALLVGGSEAAVVTDSRYIETAQEQAQGARAVEYSGKIEETVGQQMRLLGGQRWGFEADRVYYSEYQRLAELPVELAPVLGAVEEIRAVKDSDEQAAVRHACQIAVQGLEELFLRLRPGMTEEEAAVWLDARMRELGAEGPAFDFIVASGSRGSLPHGYASQRPLGIGELVTFDVGCRFLGYNSDITRTVALGEPQAGLQRAYEVVRQAQEAGVRAVRSGATCQSVDAAARGVIERAGYGAHFGHGTGHGVGLEIHERPLLGARAEGVLSAGMIVTVEPGIYLPGTGGIRIEDTVLVTEDGCEVLTPSPKALRSFGGEGSANWRGGGLL